MEAATVERTGEESEQAALEREEDEARERELKEKREDEAREQLSFPVGGIPPTKARVQITGGAIEIPPHLMPKKDDELEIRVTGWVKTVKHTTENKGGIAAREAVFVVEDLALD